MAVKSLAIKLVTLVIIPLASFSQETGNKGLHLHFGTGLAFGERFVASSNRIGLSYFTENGIISSQLTFSRNIFPGESSAYLSPLSSIRELSILIGIAENDAFSRICLATGFSFVEARNHPSFGGDYRSSAGFSFEGLGYLKVMPKMSIGLELFGNLNRIRSYVGLSASIGVLIE